LPQAITGVENKNLKYLCQENEQAVRVVFFNVLEVQAA